jgi:manganese/zinc/iron transport system ATP- binding protein
MGIGAQSQSEEPEQSLPPLQVEGLCFAYEQTPVLENISFKIKKGALTAIIGPNGAGKSTLLKTCLGLVRKTSGEVSFFGKSLEQVRQKVAYMPQRTAVDWSFPASALDIVCMGLYRHIGWLRPVTKKHKYLARLALGRVGMEEFAERQIGALSGGQQQRVFLARALIQNPDLYIMDEPFSGIDAASEKNILESLLSLKGEGKTVLCVHHDLQTVKSYFDEALLLNVNLITAGPVEKVITKENLSKGYGGQLLLGGL